jgi:hypothetical protein
MGLKFSCAPLFISITVPSRLNRLNFIILLDSLHYAMCTTFSMLDNPGGTGCDEVCFPVHGGWDNRNVSGWCVIVSKSV